MGLKPAQEPPSAKLSTQKVPICLILTTYWDEITFGHIKRCLGADFKETHFFQRHPVEMVALGENGIPYVVKTKYSSRGSVISEEAVVRL